MKKTLADLLPGERAAVLKLNLTGRLRRRLMDIGLIEGTEVECVGLSPLGDPKRISDPGKLLWLSVTATARES